MNKEAFYTLTRIVLHLHRENNNSLTWRPELFSTLVEQRMKMHAII